MSHPSHDDAPPQGRHPLLDPRPQPETPQQQQGRRAKLNIPGRVSRPIVTYALVAINAAIWMLNLVSVEQADALYRWGIQFSDLVIENYEFYRLFTAMFLHADVTHVFFNCLTLYYIGREVETFFGHARFLTIYLLGGLLGSVLSLYVNAAVLGASGAVFAIWGADAIFLYQHRQLFGEGAMQRLRWTGIMVFFNFAIGIISNIEGSRRIANFAHLGGLVGGMILAWQIGPRFVVESIQEIEDDLLQVNLQGRNPLMNKVGVIIAYCLGLLGLLLLAFVL